MTKLTEQKCVPCEGGVKPLTANDFTNHSQELTGWQLKGGDSKIYKKFEFKDFSLALAFINQVGDLAEKAGHHPDILLHNYNKVDITLYTHAIGGLSLNDFILASKINQI